jgi:small-conductance mechanosensitive channel
MRYEKDNIELSAKRIASNFKNYVSSIPIQGRQINKNLIFSTDVEQIYALRKKYLEINYKHVYDLVGEEIFRISSNKCLWPTPTFREQFDHLSSKARFMMYGFRF